MQRDAIGDRSDVIDPAGTATGLLVAPVGIRRVVLPKETIATMGGDDPPAERRHARTRLHPLLGPISKSGGQPP